MTHDPFSLTQPLLAASILSADFSALAAEIADVDAGGADFVHLDVMDGHFVPNISFGPAIIKGARKATQAYFDVHLMISDPLRYAPAMVKAGGQGGRGGQNLTFHVEAVDRPEHVARELRKLGCQVGVTLKPATPVEAIWPVIDLVDVVLVMSVEPGFSGQEFMMQALPKAEQIKKRLASHQRLEIDGGINAQTIASAQSAGVDWFVCASAIFGAADRARAIAELRAQLR